MSTEGAFETFLAVLTKHYADFQGRSGRREFWLFMVTSFCLSIGCEFVDVLINTRYVGSIFALAMLLPTLGISVRRLHDLNKSGWWLAVPFGPALLAFLLVRSATGTIENIGYFASHSSPMFTLLLKLALGWLVGYVVLISWLIQPGTNGPNKYGAEPGPVGVGSI